MSCKNCGYKGRSVTEVHTFEGCIKRLLKVIQAQDLLLIQYRCGAHRSPPGWVFDTLAEFKDK